LAGYPGALCIQATSPDGDVDAAAERLASGTGPVLFDGQVVLRRAAGRLACQVIDRSPGMRRCAVEYEVMLENARRALEASALSGRLPSLVRHWTVVELRGDEVMTAWPGPDGRSS
jgi:hypothetical protein